MKCIRDRIAKLAHEKYLYREKNQMFFTTDELGNLREITAQDDWLEAEDMIIRKLKKEWR